MMGGGPWGALAGGILGGIFGSQGTKVPKPPTYEEIMSNNITSQGNVQQQLLDAEGKWRPKYQTLQEQTLNRQLYGGDGTAGYLNMLSNANTAMYGLQQQAAGQYMNTMFDVMPTARNLAMSPQMQSLQNEMTRQANEGLYNGTALNADEQRLAWQNANSAMSMSGLGGRQRVAAGVLSNYALGQQRQDRNRAYAQAQLTNETAMQNAAFSVGANAMNQYNAGGQLMGFANQTLGQYEPQIFNPEAQMGYNTQVADWKVRMGVATGEQQGLADAFNLQGAQQRRDIQNGGQGGGGGFGGFGGMPQGNGTFGSGPFGQTGTSFSNYTNTVSSLQGLSSLFGGGGGGGASAMPSASMGQMPVMPF